MKASTRTLLEGRIRDFRVALDANDHEQAHQIADNVWMLALALIMAGEPDPAEIARLALSTEEHEYQRWCA